MEQELAQTLALTNQQEKSTAFTALLQLHEHSRFELGTVIDALLQENVGLVVSKAALSHFIGDDVAANKLSKEALELLLERLQPRLVSFEEQVWCDFR